MMTIARCPRALPVLVLYVFFPAIAARGALPKVPDGFEVRLVATVPAVLYPCQVATAPDGALFVAEDPMDQVGPYESKHGRILRFLGDRDPVVFASGFRAVQGMAWHDNALYVSHMPFLTVLRDLDGDGKAESRRELFQDLGPTANQGLNDHIVSGLQFGMDGFLYISVGDKGIPKATGPDGRTIQIVGGGTCRCRPDGTGLEVVSTGTRNHLEVNLDERDNLFTYDNTDDGLGWWTRVTHHVDGGYYGYPYDYHDRPDRHLPRMAEYGGGSPCGAVLYKEDAWPERYRGVGFWAEWGKGKVHAFRFAPEGASFRVAEEIDFAIPNGVDNFRPIDLALSYDGRTLYIADWGMGGWGSKTEKVGRVFAVTYRGEVQSRPRGTDSDPIAAQIRQLDHPSFNERMRAQDALVRRGREALSAVTGALSLPGTSPLARRHLIWALQGIAGGTPEATVALLETLKSEVADVRAQAARALGTGSDGAAERGLIEALGDREAPVRLQAVIALGRRKSRRAVSALIPHLAETDDFIAFSVRQALRRIGDWNETASGLSSSAPAVREKLLAAMECVYDADTVGILARFAGDPTKRTPERALALRYLAQVHHKAKPWNGQWWGTRPADGKPPAKVDSWEGTALVLRTIRDRLEDPAVPLRLAAVAAVKETGDRDALAVLRRIFVTESDPDVRIAIAQAFGALDDQGALPLLIAEVRALGTPAALRDAALGAVEKIGTDPAIEALIALINGRELDGTRLARVIAALGRFRAPSAVEPVTKALADSSPKVRAAAASALAQIGRLEGVGRPLRGLLEDRDLEARKAAITALGVLADREAIPALLAAADSAETRFEAISALAAMPDVLALQSYLNGLADKSPELRRVSAEALAKIRTQAAPILEQLADRHELSRALVPELRKVYSSLEPVTDWHLIGPFKIDDKPPFAPEQPIDLTISKVGRKGEPLLWKAAKPVDDQGRMDLNRDYPSVDDLAAFGYAEVSSPEARSGQLAVGSDDTMTIWLNGKKVYEYLDRRGFEAAKDRCNVELVKGTNRILVKCGNRGGGWVYSVALSFPPNYAFLKGPSNQAFDPEKYREYAMRAQGKVEHGEALFQDLRGLACIKCHAVGTQGGKVGPELSSVGAKYARAELVASVLFPSARISSGYEPVVVATSDGRVLTGIIKSETADALEIEDADARRIRIPKDDIEDRKRSEVSLMPTGLAEGLSPQDFADVIAYLETLKNPEPKPAGSRGGR